MLLLVTGEATKLAVRLRSTPQVYRLLKISPNESRRSRRPSDKTMNEEAVWRAAGLSRSRGWMDGNHAARGHATPGGDPVHAVIWAPMRSSARQTAKLLVDRGE
jgi:hypothetical protein